MSLGGGAWLNRGRPRCSECGSRPPIWTRDARAAGWRTAKEGRFAYHPRFDSLEPDALEQLALCPSCWRTAIGREGDAKRDYERQRDRYEAQQRREARSRWTARTLADAAGQENAVGSMIQSLESSYGGLREAVESVGGRIDGSGAHAFDARGRPMQWANAGAANSLARFWKTGSLLRNADDLPDVCERHVELSDSRLEMVLTVRLPDGCTEVRKAVAWRDEHKPPHNPFVIYRADLPERPPEPVTHTVREEDPGTAELLEEVRRAKEAARRRKCGWCGTMNEPWSDTCDGCNRSF